MTLNEFKAWLDGYSESFKHYGSPSQEQWKKIKDQLNKVVVFEYKGTPNTDPYGNPRKINPYPYIWYKDTTGTPDIGNLPVSKCGEINHRVMDPDRPDKYY